MPSLLLADAGSTKTCWRLTAPGSGKDLCWITAGINPYLQQPEEILLLLQSEALPGAGLKAIDSIAYYGAGASAPENQKIIRAALKKTFGVKEVTVQGDMLGAARAVAGRNKSVVSILGTGSNACFYNGSRITAQQASLGWLAGDEGSGNYMGRQVLQHYAYKTFDEVLQQSFEAMFGASLPDILHRLYHGPFPNRYLASMVQLLVAHRGHFMVENIIEDSLSDFFQAHIFRISQSWKYPLSFCGSIAWQFRDVIQELCSQYELECGAIMKDPMDGLVEYHKA